MFNFYNVILMPLFYKYYLINLTNFSFKSQKLRLLKYLSELINIFYNHR